MWKIFGRRGAQASRSNESWTPLPIVADAAIASPAIGDGRFIPLLIVDTTQRQDIFDLIRIHDKVPPGDAISTWGELHGSRDHIALVLEFLRPIEALAVLNFDLAERGIVVDLARRAQAIYLQAGKPGDRFYKSMDSPRILIEIGAEMSAARWEHLWEKAIRRRFRTLGYSRSEARKMSRDYIDEFRTAVQPATGNIGTFEGGNPSQIVIIKTD